MGVIPDAPNFLTLTRKTPISLVGVFLLPDFEQYVKLRAMINVEVQRNNNESAPNVLKRFTKRVQGAGILNRVRGLRYAERTASPYVKKKRTLKALRRRKERDLQVKLGKVSETYQR